MFGGKLKFTKDYNLIVLHSKMSSYQRNPEDGNSSAINADDVGQSKRSWGSLVLVCGVGIATAVFALSSTSRSASVATSFTTVNSGPNAMSVPRYSKLSDDEFRSLFTDFKSKFGRQVRQHVSLSFPLFNLLLFIFTVRRC